MKRAAKILLILGAVGALVNAAVTAAASFLVGFFTMGSGIGLSVAGIVNLSLLVSITDLLDSVTYDTNMTAYTSMTIAGFSAFFIGIIVTLCLVAFVTLLEIVGAIAFINVSALEDKKAGYIISIVFGAFTLLAGETLIGLFIILGGVFGLIGLRKEKKQKEQELVEAK